MYVDLKNGSRQDRAVIKLYILGQVKNINKIDCDNLKM